MPQVQVSIPAGTAGLVLLPTYPGEVGLFYRNADGTVEPSWALNFRDNGGGISCVIGSLSSGSAFMNNGAGRIVIENP